MYHRKSALPVVVQVAGPKYALRVVGWGGDPFGRQAKSGAMEGL